MIKKLLITSVLAGCMSVGWADVDCKEMFDRISFDHVYDVLARDNDQVVGHLTIYNKEDYRCTDNILSMKVNGMIEYRNICIEAFSDTIALQNNVNLSVKMDDRDNISIPHALIVDATKVKTSTDGRCLDNTVNKIKGSIFLKTNFWVGKPSDDTTTW